ncbi:MAG: aminoacyl-tRNA deacylase [Terriglobales bacterium]
MPVTKLREFLDSNNVKYTTTFHSTAYTAQEIASRAHIAGRQMAKTVIVKLDGELAMAVLPASHQVDTYALKKLTQAEKVTLATEFEFKTRFPDCETGAMPPFGNLYGMRVFVEEDLAKDVDIAFNAGSHTELMMLAYKDFERLVNPIVAKFSTRRLVAKGAAAGEDRLW